MLYDSRTEETDPPKKPNIHRYCLLSCPLQVSVYKHISGWKMMTCSITLTQESRITRPPPIFV